MEFLRKHKELLIILVILVIAAFFRLYRISDYMTFLGDEGRDVLVVRDILHGHLTLLGPRASAGNFFTGPIYYYMMAPFLLFFNYDPVGPAVMIALLGIATVWLIYYVGKKWFGTVAGLMAASLYAVSPLVLEYSRSSWNPNPMPFFTLVILYLLYRAVKTASWKLFLSVGILYGIAFQLHYIMTFVGPIIFFFLLIAILFPRIGHSEAIQKNLRKKVTGSFTSFRMTDLVALLKNYLILFLGFLIGFSPFLAFELRHQFANTKTILQFISYGNSHDANSTHLSFFQLVSDVFFRLFDHLLAWHLPFIPLTSSPIWWNVIIIILAISSLIAILFVKDRLAQLILGLWFLFGVGLFGFYHKPIYDYYFEFMFPLPFLLIGNLLSIPFSNKFKSDLSPSNKGVLFVIKIAALVIFMVLLLVNLLDNPFQYAPNKQKDQMKRIAEFVMKQADNKPFNFALLTSGNSDHAYRYFMEIENHPPVTIEDSVVDPNRQTVTQQLFVVCEDPTNCHPLGASLWEIAGFGRADIAGEWMVNPVEVVKLTHYKGT